MLGTRVLSWMVAAATLSAPASARDLRSSDVNPPGSPTVEAAAHLGKLLAERTGGRLRLQTLGAGDRDSENFTIAQVRTGAQEMARVNIAAFNATVPSTVLLSLPFLFKSTAHLRRVLDGPIGASILASLEDQEVVGLCFYDAGPRSLYTQALAIRSVDDMKGLRVRVQPGDLAPIVVKALGATAVPMPYSHIGAALKAGAIDAADSNWPAYVGDGHYRYARVYNETKHARPPGVVVVSRSVWRELSAEDQAVLKQAAQESVLVMRKVFEERERQARVEAEKEGVRVVEDVDRKSFADVLLPMYPDLLHTAGQLNLLSRIQALEPAATP